MLSRSQSFEKMRSQHGKRGRHAAICAGGQGRRGREPSSFATRAHLCPSTLTHAEARPYTRTRVDEQMFRKAFGVRPKAGWPDSQRHDILLQYQVAPLPLPPSFLALPRASAFHRVLLIIPGSCVSSFTFSFFAPQFLPPVGNMPRNDRYECNDSDSKTINGSAT